MSKTTKDDLAAAAQILRTAADLIEQKIINEFDIRVDWATRDEPDPKFHGYTMHRVHTGGKTLTIRMQIGHLKATPEFDIGVPLITAPTAKPSGGFPLLDDDSGVAPPRCPPSCHD